MNLTDRIKSLNTDQARVFNRVSEHLLHQKEHESGLCSCSDYKPLRLFVSGVGGTGKSFLIEAITAQVAETWSELDSSLTCAVAAPTGLAAFNVGGVTIHRLFQLPVEHDAKTAVYWSLPKDSQKQLRTVLRNIKLIIIDEVSMLSSQNLAYIHLCLEEVFGSGDWFGSINMLFVGDLLQLPPVNGAQVFEKMLKKSVLTKMGCMTCVNIWGERVVYDELTIIERQKDSQFCELLNEVRCGEVSDKTVAILKERVISVSAVEKFNELVKAGQSPVCLFSKREPCQRMNTEMLNSLESKTVGIVCCDEVDETTGPQKWSKKAAEKLEKLNKDSNLTAGLEAVLYLAVGARVMLRRNIDTTNGLVNGVCGTVTAVGKKAVTVKFDHDEKEHAVEKVKSRFFVMKNFSVYRKQFPLVLAYAVTIHKSQGLSLDCAILDLSDNVFSPGMAYVALSRVRTLSGVHLIEFDQYSIFVCSKSLQEFNRLRGLYRPDLPTYKIANSGKKRKLSGVCSVGNDMVKKPRADKKRKRSRNECDNPTKKARIEDNSLEIVDVQEPEYRWNPVDAEWQHVVCGLLNVPFHGPNHVQAGSPIHALTPPTRNMGITGDGNCMFRAISYIVTGSEDCHLGVRVAVVNYMSEIEPFLIVNNLLGEYTMGEYIESSRMNLEGAWGTGVEIASLAHMLNTNIYTYHAAQEVPQWVVFTPRMVDDRLPIQLDQRSIYLYFNGNHYNVVMSVLE